MARIRTVKPEMWQDEDLARCSPHARLLAIALLQLADSEGRLKWIPMQVHAHAFPFEEGLNIEDLAGELEQIGYVQRYRVDGKRYGFIPGFNRHQRLSGKEAAEKSKLPPYEASVNEAGSDENFPGKRLDAQEQGTGNREREREREQVKALSSEPADADPPDVLVLDQPRQREPDAVRQVFDHWRTRMNHPGANLDDKRKRHIRQRLKDGYTPDQLCKAIDGCALTPHNMGQNDNGQKYDGLHVIFRDADQVDRFMRNADAPPRPVTDADRRTSANLRAAHEFANGG